MNRILSAAPALTALAVTTVLTAVPAPAQVNRIVLRVNDEIATLYDYEEIKAQQLAALARADIPEDQKQEIAARIGEETMQQLFEEMLILSRAEQLGVAIPPAALDEAMRGTMESVGVESVEDFAAGLAASGLTLERWREQTARNLLVREVMGREIQERVTLEEEDLRRYYRANLEQFRRPRRVELREIVVLDSPETDDAEQRRIADELASLIRAGDEDLEARISGLELAGSTTGWIELGWVEPSDLDARLQPLVAELATGEVSEPTRARGGLHILQALEVEESRIQEFAEVRDAIELRERERLFGQEAQAYLEELVDNSYVESQPPPEAAGFRPFRGPRAEAEEVAEGG